MQTMHHVMPRSALSQNSLACSHSMLGMQEQSDCQWQILASHAGCQQQGRTLRSWGQLGSGSTQASGSPSLRLRLPVHLLLPDVWRGLSAAHADVELPCLLDGLWSGRRCLGRSAVLPGVHIAVGC